MPDGTHRAVDHEVAPASSSDARAATDVDAIAKPAATRPVLPVPDDTPGSTARWWAGVGVAGVFSLPFAWLLSYAASLPFFLGLFFFMLFGLLIGAVAYRVAAPRRPYSSIHLVIGTTVLVALVWSVSMVKESSDFPGDIADRAVQRTRNLGDQSVAQFRGKVADDVRRFLAERYPPGGVSGYVRWVLTSGELKRGDLTALDRGISVPAAQTRIWWAIRVVFSIALLGLGIGSQTLTMSRSREPGARVTGKAAAPQA
jgi:hypothetical protein